MLAWWSDAVRGDPLIESSNAFLPIRIRRSAAVSGACHQAGKCRHDALVRFSHRLAGVSQETPVFLDLTCRSELEHSVMAVRLAEVDPQGMSVCADFVAKVG